MRRATRITTAAASAAVFLATSWALPPPERQKRLEEFQDWRFGVFVHWGPTAGYGRTRYLAGEERANAIANFERQATAFDAAAWLDTIQESGARYMTVTAKHGDGYCLFKTRMSENPAPESAAAEAPTKRDFIAELAAECHKRNFPIFFYLNLNSVNWGRAARDNFANWDQDKELYYTTMTAWLRELCEQYRPAGIWLDTWPLMNGQFRKAGKAPSDIFDFERLLAPVRQTDPAILVGNKQLIPPHIDFLESERIFSGHFAENLWEPQGAPVESCALLPGSSFFATRKTQEDFLTPAEIEEATAKRLKELVSCAGMGNNYLLDAGPLPNGEFQRVEAAILKGVGRWLERNGEAIYGSRQGPFEPWDGGYDLIKGDRLYLHALNNVNPKKGKRPFTKSGLPEDGKISVGPAPWQPASAHLLNDERPIPFTIDEGRIALDLSALQPDPLDTIIVLEKARDR